MASTTSDQDQLKDDIQNAPSGTVEKLAAALIGRLLGIGIVVARSGFQYGGDAGTAGEQGRRLRIECKRYADTNPLNERELLGEIDQAMARDPALEVWVLVATRPVHEQLKQTLVQKGEGAGIPVLVLSWADPPETADLAALCASAPEVVSQIISPTAGKLAVKLQPSTLVAVEQLRRNLQAWSIGYETLRSAARQQLFAIWDSAQESNAALGQDAAGGTRSKRVVRESVRSSLDDWLSTSDLSAPAVITGWDGVGKTWATVEWLVEGADQLPIPLVIPSSAWAPSKAISETILRSFLGDRLCELTKTRDSAHWQRRLHNLLLRPETEGPVLLLLFDGLNQEPSVPWLSLFKVLQGSAFAGKVRVVASTRTHHYESRLGRLRGLVTPAVEVPVDVYDLTPGGEFDQMLAFEGLVRADLHPELLPLARTPRLFALVMQFRTRLVDVDQVTVHRLLWEYGRDTFGARAGRSFSEEEWRGWLAEVAERHRGGIRRYSTASLAETAQRPDLEAREVYARLSDIIDTPSFVNTVPGRPGHFELTATIVAHALGAALLDTLESLEPPTYEAVDAELNSWLDPISGLDQRAEILRASVSILVERGSGDGTPVSGLLVTAWLQTQNVPDAHRREVAALAGTLVQSLLDALERSQDRAHASARLWAVNALRSIDRKALGPLQPIVDRTTRWNATVSREVGSGIPESERRRAERLSDRIGVDQSGAVSVLGVTLQLVDRDFGSLASTTPSILEAFPLAPALPVFTSAAVAQSVGGRHASWDGLKWLCLLNGVDFDATRTALRDGAAAMRAFRPEAGVNAALPARVAALLLWLTGHEDDDVEANQIDPRLDHLLTYEKDYLPDPARSWLELERRHAAQVLEDQRLPLLSRAQRCRDFLLDPTFEPPAAFIAEARTLTEAFDPRALDRHSSPTVEDHNFEELEPVLARCGPDLLSGFTRRKLRALRDADSSARYWSGIRATEHLLLAGDAEAAAARDLRLSGADPNPSNETFVSNRLLMIETHGAPGVDQVRAVVGAGLRFVLTDFAKVMNPLTRDEVHGLVGEFGSGTVEQKRDLLTFLAEQPTELTDVSWTWALAAALGSDPQLRGLAFAALNRSDSERLGRDLLTAGWAWIPGDETWMNHHGSGALIRGGRNVPFDQLAPKLAPWRLLEAARLRGDDPAEVRLAAAILDRVLVGMPMEPPDPGSDISIFRWSAEANGPFLISVRARESVHDGDDPAGSLRAALDIEAHMQAQNRAANAAVARIRDAWQAGASLYLTDIEPSDMRCVTRNAPEFVDRWLEGMETRTPEFRRRVWLAEGLYVALCEALLTSVPQRGAELWAALRNTLRTRFVGPAGVDDLLHLLFRAPSSEPLVRLRENQLSLLRTNTDEALFNLAIAAEYNGAGEWLRRIIEEDRRSGEAWRRRRGVVLGGFRSASDVNVEVAWPEGEPVSAFESLRRQASRSLFRISAARHWWRTYLGAESPDTAYAAWILFKRTADRRARVWMAGDVRALNQTTSFQVTKLKHVELNQTELRTAMEKWDDKRDRRFLLRDIVSGVGPWGKAEEDE